MKNLKSCVLSILVTITIITFCNCAQAKERFVTLNFEQETNNPPVALNENEIFFAGGWDGFDRKKIYTAKKYDIKNKKLIDLNVTMNVARLSYNTYKYDANHILILGGSCAETNIKNCSQIAEIYDIKENKFSLVEKAPLDYRGVEHNTKTSFRIDDNNIIIILPEGIMKFNTQDRKFTKLITFNTQLNIDYGATELTSGDILIWGYSKSAFGVRGTKLRILHLYNHSKNTLTEVYREEFTKRDFAPSGTFVVIKNNLLRFYGNEKYGKIFSANLSSINDFKFQEIGKTNLGTLASSGVAIDDKRILLAGGCIKSDYYPFYRGKYLERGILNIKTGKIINIKTNKTGVYNTFLLPLNSHAVFITGYKYTKPTIFYY